jgi:putative ABC transport system ATP-binding protein
MTAVLEVEQVARTYGSGHTQVRALDGVTLSVQPGELVAVMGPSGAGKSTLLQLAGGLDRPSGGSIRVTGTDLGGLGRAGLATLRRRRVGYVFQELNLIAALTAAENVALPRELDGVRARAARSEALAALELVGLPELAGTFPDQLSGGEQQRVAIARALVGQRPLLLADEPTGALDTLAGEGILGLLRARCDAGVAALLVTHEPRYAGYADRIIFLTDGRVIDQTAQPPTVAGRWS